MLRSENPNFIEAVIGFIFEPSATIQSLLDNEDPPFSLSLLISLMLTIFVPIVAQLIKYDLKVDPASVFAIGIVALVTIFVFIIVEGLLLLIFGFQLTLSQLVAAVMYSSVPLMCALWLIFIANYIASGNISLVTYLLTGIGRPNDSFIQILPFAFSFAVALMTINFFYAIRWLGDCFGMTALAITLISLFPLGASAYAGLLAGEYIRPGIIGIFLGLQSLW